MKPSKNEADYPQTPAVEPERNRVDRWLQPTGSQAVILVLGILALIVLIRELVYKTGGTGFAWLHLMYLPIILSAAVFGIYGGIGAALAGGLALGPYMPMNATAGLPQTTSSWMFRIGFFLLVGTFSGLISNFLNGQINRLRQTHHRLLEAHEQLKSTQMQLIQTAKLESVGRLAAGVAHEVKNPLAVIQLGIDYLARTARDTAGRDAVETIQEMANAVQRADTVVKELLNFSRSEPLALVLVDLNSVIEESLLLVRHELTRNHVSLEKHLADRLPRLELDPNKIKQVLINVFMNAIQSIGDEGGIISVKTFGAPAPAGNAGPRSAGGFVIVEIEDNGAGIPGDKLDKLFEPFFTTKAVGSGTGLGLSVSRNIIELHRGTIRIANRKSVRGVIVTIMFPIPIRGSL